MPVFPTSASTLSHHSDVGREADRPAGRLVGTGQESAPAAIPCGEHEITELSPRSYAHQKSSAGVLRKPVCENRPLTRATRYARMNVQHMDDARGPNSPHKPRSSGRTRTCRTPAPGERPVRVTATPVLPRRRGALPRTCSPGPTLSLNSTTNGKPPCRQAEVANPTATPLHSFSTHSFVHSLMFLV